MENNPSRDLFSLEKALTSEELERFKGIPPDQIRLFETFQTRVEKSPESEQKIWNELRDHIQGSQDFAETLLNAGVWRKAHALNSSAA